MWAEAAVLLPSGHLRTEESAINVGQDSRSSGRYSKPRPPEYEAELSDTPWRLLVGLSGLIIFKPATFTCLLKFLVSKFAPFSCFGANNEVDLT
jgi:hypothetical protein